MSPEFLESGQNNVLEEISLPPDLQLKKTKGKVRDIYDLEDGRLIIIATDRLSAFDRQVGVVENRGQILTRLSKWWFENTSDIVPNHMLSVPHPNIMLVKKYPRIDLEMVVRGFNTGSTSTSIWKRYQEGQRKFGEIVLPDGMKKDDPLPVPIVDPSSKAVSGHDRNLTKEEIINSKILTEEEYDELELTSLSLFQRGQELSDKAGLILVDTKYEFGKDPSTGKIVLIDEIHTPDSSRFWSKNSHSKRTELKLDQYSYDKEFLRLWFTGAGYKGDEENLPPIPKEIASELKRRYIFAFESLTNEIFEPLTQNINESIITTIRNLLK